MNSTLVLNVLNAAASTDPQVMQSASLQLREFAGGDEEDAKPTPQFLTALSACVFSGVLSSNAQLMGLIHLKNIVANQLIWPQVDKEEKLILLNAVLSYLSTGATDSHQNTVEQCPRLGRFVAEIVSAIFRSEWVATGVWPEAIWSHLPDISAWLSLRRCLKRASALRLPVRRRALASHVASILPKLVTIWSSSPPSSSRSLLLHVIHTCLTSAMDERAAAEVVRASSDMSITLVRQAFERLAEEPKYANRTAKLIHCVFTLLPAEVRSENALGVLQTIIKKLPDVDVSSGLWLMAVVYNLLAASLNLPLSDSLSRAPVITENARKQIHAWLFQPSSEDDTSTNALRFLLSLMQHTMTLSSDELIALYDQSEAVYSSGGVSLHVKGRVCYAPAIWDANGRLPCAYVFPYNGSDYSLRHLAEATLFLLTQHFPDQISAPLLNILQTMYSISNGTPLSRELILRCAQISIFSITGGITSKEEKIAAWCAQFDVFTATELSVSMNSTSSIEDFCVLCRALALLVRRAVISPHESISADNAILQKQHQGAIDLLLPFLHHSTGLSRSHSIGVRLATAHSLQWLMEQPDFQSDCLSTYLPQILNALLSLAQDVEECETRLLILSYIRSTLEVLDVENNPSLYCHFLNILDPLWQLGSGAITLRASILNLIALLMYALNASPATGSASGGLAFSLQEKVIDVVANDLAAHNDDDDADEDREEVLFEPSLRLWHSLVSGRGAVWSQELNRLMPVLTGASSFDKTLYARLESSAHAQLYFEIASGCLRLAVPVSGEDVSGFLANWTEPFWALALTEALTHFLVANSCGRFSEATDTGESDHESLLVVEQVHLLSAWMGRLIAASSAKEISFADASLTANDGRQGPGTISPSVSGLLMMHTHTCLHQTPVEVHNDVCFKATQTRLLILAQLACSPAHWYYLLQLVTWSQSVPDNEVTFAEQCRDLTATPPTHSTGRYHPLLLENLLSRIISRADSLSNRLERRCFAVAALVCLLVHMGASAPGDVALNQESVYSRWLEPAISLCVQVLFEEDLGISLPDSVWEPPMCVLTHERTRETIQSLLQMWRKCLGSDELASAVVNAHVDSALLAQLNERLVSTN